MKAFVLAAGFGTRMMPFTEHLPKPLVPVLNVPSLFYTFALLKNAGITQIICNIHHHAEVIRRAVEAMNFTDLQIVFSEENPILGTGGGLKKCESLLDDDDFFIVNSDIITDIDFRKLHRHHRSSGLAGTLALYETPDAAAIGAVGIDDGLVLDFRNMRKTGLATSLIYTGTAILSPAIFDYLERGFSSIVDTGFTGLIDNGGLGAYLHPGSWMDIGTHENYLMANTDGDPLPERLSGKIAEAIGIMPCHLSPEATVAPDATVIRSVIGRGCRIGKGATVEASVLLPDAVVESGETLRRIIRDRHHTVVLP